ncbi:MAG: hypothetical protein EDM05_66970 [Leptolyngbya sp. IPPAS B-1204]
MSDRSPGRFESVVGAPIARSIDPKLALKFTLSLLIALVELLSASVAGWTCIAPAIASIVQLIAACISASSSCPVSGWQFGLRW